MSTGLLHVETMVRDGPGEGSASTWPKPRKRPLPGTHPDYPFKNLVLEGGGARGGAYCGALLELEKLGQTESQPGALDYVSRFAGSSAGAMVAMNLALGYSAEDIDRVASATDMEKTVQDANLCCGAMQLLDLCCCCCSKGRLGVFPGNSSRRRDCHSAAPPSTFSRCFNSDGERASAK